MTADTGWGAQFSISAGGQTIAWGYQWEDGKADLRMMDDKGDLAEGRILLDDLDALQDLYRRTNAVITWEI